MTLPKSIITEITMVLKLERFPNLCKYILHVQLAVSVKSTVTTKT